MKRPLRSAFVEIPRIHFQKSVHIIAGAGAAAAAAAAANPHKPIYQPKTQSKVVSCFLASASQHSGSVPEQT